MSGPGDPARADPPPPTLPVRPDEIVLRDESFVLLRVREPQVLAVRRRLASLPGRFQFSALEEDGLSLLVSHADADELGDLVRDADREEPRYRVITFVPDMAWTVVGFLHGVCGVLADEGVPLGAVSAFARDHLFVRADLAERALEALRAAARGPGDTAAPAAPGAAGA